MQLKNYEGGGVTILQPAMGHFCNFFFSTKSDFFAGISFLTSGYKIFEVGTLSPSHKSQGERY